MKKFLLSIFAVLFAFAGVQAQTWTKVTDASTLKAGDKLVIACDSKNVVAGDITSQYLSKKAATFAENTISSLPADAVVLTLGGTSGAWTLSNENSKLLGATGAKKVAWGSGTTTWSISIEANGNATIQNGTSSYGRFLYNNSNPRFTTYTSNASSSMLLPQLYRLEVAGGEGGGEGTPVAPAAPTLPAACSFDDTMTVEITGIADGATAYYSLNDENNWVAGTSVKITETTTVYAKAVKDELSSGVVSATYTKNEPVTPPAEGDYVIDELTHSWAGITGQNYSNWSGKKATSSAVYAGNSAGDKSSIQLRATNPSGIVTTKSGGKAKKIVVEWNSGTAEGRTLDVYGKNSAYSEATDLYNTSTRGTKLGSIVFGKSTELVIDGDYEYIGLRSNSGAMYLTSISISWDASNVVVVPDAPMLPTSGDFVTSKNIEITNFNDYENGTTVYYSINGEGPMVYTAAFKITTTCEIVAYAEQDGKKSAEVRAEYTRIAKDPVINVVGDTDPDAFEGSIEVEIETENGATAYYTLNGEEPTVESTKYEGALTIKATATLKVIAVEEGEYRSKNVVDKTFTMALKDTSVDTDASSATFDASEQNYNNGAAITSVTIVEGITATFDKGSNSNSPKYYTSGYAIRCYGGNNFTIESTAGTITKIVLTFSSGENNNNITTDCGEFSTNTWVGNAESVKFTIGGSSGHRRIQTITVTYGEPKNENYSLKVTSAGWATLFLDYAVAIPEGVTCYTVSAVDGEYATLAEVEGVIPANTAVIVEAEAGNYTLEVATEAGSDVANELRGTTVNKYIFEDAYVLGVVDGVVGLYKAEMKGGVWLNNANKAYLPKAAGMNLASYSFRFGEGTTGIDEITDNREQSTVIYDLTGRRIEAITAPGIYVVNGKKVLVK